MTPTMPTAAPSTPPPKVVLPSTLPAAGPSMRLPLQGLQAGFRLFTVDEYHKLIDAGLFAGDERYELLNGYLVRKISRKHPHDGTLTRIEEWFVKHLPAQWSRRVQCGITLDNSEPEPDIAVVRGNSRSFDQRQPVAADLGIVIEVADSTLLADRADKGEIYARNGVPEYWLVNLIDGRIEVYTQPSGPGVTPGYASRQDYPPGSAVPVVFDGVAVAAVNVADILP